MGNKKKQMFDLEKSLKFAQGSAFEDFSTKLLAWYKKEKASHPWRLLWEKHKDPYHVWVSEIMLQQTVIKAVTPLYVEFIKKFPTVFDLAKAKEESLRTAVKGLGYYSRFDRLHRAAKDLCAKKDFFEWPQTFLEWKKLPGVGDYTASAISSIAFNEVKAVVDGNVERVFSRLFEIYEPINSAPMKKSLQEISESLICKKNPGDYNQAIMELGQTHCSKNNPSCKSCPVSFSCISFKKNTQNSLPNVLKREEKVDVDLYLFVIQKKNKFFLSKREGATPFLKNRPGFFLLRDLEKKPLKKEICGVYKHTITKHNIKVHVVLGSEEMIKKEKGIWVEAKKLQDALMTSLDLKALKVLWELKIKLPWALNKSLAILSEAKDLPKTQNGDLSLSLKMTGGNSKNVL